MVYGIQSALLGRSVIRDLNVFPRLHVVIETALKVPVLPKEYANILQGRLGKVHTKYSIAQHPDRNQFAITYPRRVHLLLLPAVLSELERMEKYGLIELVEQVMQ